MPRSQKPNPDPRAAPGISPAGVASCNYNGKSACSCPEVSGGTNQGAQLMIVRSLWPGGSSLDRGHHQPHEAVALGRVDPAQDRDDVVLRIDPGQIAAGAACEIARLGGARIEEAPGVEPPEIAVL